MASRVLEVRGIRFVLLAYAVAPTASMFLLWLGISIYEGSIGRYTLVDDLVPLPMLMVLAAVVGVVIELFVATPVLFAFFKYRWKWFNGWSMAGFGLIVGEVVWALSLALGPRHWFGWGSVVQGTAVCGFLGVSSAVIFRVVAFRVSSHSKPNGSQARVTRSSGWSDARQG